MPLSTTTGVGGKVLHALQKLVPAPKAAPEAASFLIVTVNVLKIPPKGAVLCNFTCISSWAELVSGTNRISTDDGITSVCAEAENLIVATSMEMKK